MNDARFPIKKTDHDELRFTRNAQALHCFLLVAVLASLGVGLYLLSVRWGPAADPLLDRSWYGLLAIPFVALAGWAAWHFAKHAYLIFTPLGLEVFPFWFPSKNFQVIYWSEMKSIRLTDDHKMIEIVLRGEGDSRIYIATAPMNAASRKLLARAIRGVNERNPERAAASSNPHSRTTS